jgi:hypothetical protein
MSPTVLLILWTAFAAMNWGLFGWLIAWGIKRNSGRDRMPLWPIIGGALGGATLALLYGPPAFLLEG